MHEEIDWFNKFVEAVNVIKRLDEHYSFNTPIREDEGFAHALGYSSHKIFKLNEAHARANALLEPDINIAIEEEKRRRRLADKIIFVNFAQTVPA